MGTDIQQIQRKHTILYHVNHSYCSSSRMYKETYLRRCDDIHQGSWTTTSWTLDICSGLWWNKKIKEDEWFHRVKKGSKLIVSRKTYFKQEDIDTLEKIFKEDKIIFLDDSFRFIEIETGAEVEMEWPTMKTKNT